MGARRVVARCVVALAVAAAAGAALAGCGGKRETRAARPPNVLLVTIDTFRADHLGASGYARATTPVLDSLAASGARFTQAISPAPETAPSHATILTGLYPPEHGVRSNGVYALRDNVPTFAERARGAGYRTAAFVGSFVLDRKFGLARGFDVYDDLMNAGGSADGGGARGGGADAGARDDHTAPADSQPLAVWYGNIVEGAFERRARDVNAAAMRWLERSGSAAAPFFLWVHFYDPHAPYEPPPEADVFPKRDPASSHARWDAFERAHLAGRATPREALAGTADSEPAGSAAGGSRRRAGDPALDSAAQAEKATLLEDLVSLYDGEIRVCDAEVGALLARLDALGLRDNTLVIVTSDHGESLTEDAYYFRHGWYLRDNVLRVPLIIRFPGRVPERTVIDEPVELGDVYATMCGTVLELAEGGGEHARAPRDLVALADRGAGGAPLAFTYSETFLRKQLVGGGPQYALRTPRWKLASNLGEPGHRRRQLYDLAQDPLEAQNLAETSPALADSLEAILRAFVAAREDTARDEATRIQPDAATIEKLRALGYTN